MHVTNISVHKPQCTPYTLRHHTCTPTMRTLANPGKDFSLAGRPERALATDMYLPPAFAAMQQDLQHLRRLH